VHTTGSDAERTLYPCALPGRLDAGAFKPPYTCKQVAHDSSNCKKFFVSTGVGTAQLCEWRGGSGCIAGSVADCSAPPPPSPPPPPPLPPPKLDDLARSALHGDVSKLKVAEEVFEDKVMPIMKESTDIVAHATGLMDWQVRIFVPLIAFLVIFGLCATLCLSPNRDLKAKRVQMSRAMQEALDRRGGGKFARVSSGGAEDAEDDSLRPVL
jgi:hypothetical protein